LDKKNKSGKESAGKIAAKTLKSFIKSGKELLKKGDNDGAISAFTAVLSNITDWDIYVDRGIAYKNKKDYDSAIADFKKALSVSGDDSFFIFTLLSASYREKGDYDASIDYCNRAIETYELIDADTYEKAMAFAYNDLAITYMAKNDREQAVSFLKQSADNGGTEALEKLNELGVKYKPNHFVRKEQYGASSVHH